jgi:hypothetical protein
MQSEEEEAFTAWLCDLSKPQIVKFLSESLQERNVSLLRAICDYLPSVDIARFFLWAERECRHSEVERSRGGHFIRAVKDYIQSVDDMKYQ